MSHHINLTRIKGVANALNDLKDDIAFVGGATVSLYADHPEQTDTRPTDDVDVLVEIATYSAYTKLQEKLAALGFVLDTEAKITCRYKYQGLVVDIMPTEEEVLGFKSRWYKEGFKHLQTYTSEHGIQIRIFPVGYFIATKLDAFKDRGNGDGRTSKDFEDIVSVLDNRETVWKDLSAYPDVLGYLKAEFMALLELPNIHEWISGHLDPINATRRSAWIIENIRAFVADDSFSDAGSV